MMSEQNRGRKSSIMPHRESQDQWEAVKPPEEGSKALPPAPQAAKPRERQTIPVEKPVVPSSPTTAKERGLQSQIDKLSEQLKNVNDWNNDLVVENIDLKMRSEEMEEQLRAQNARALNLIAILAKKEIGLTSAEGCQKFAAAVVNLAFVFKASDPRKIVPLLRKDFPKLLEALIDTVSHVKL